MAATGALPDLSSVAERALQVSTNIRRRTAADQRFGFFARQPRAFNSTSLGSGVIVSQDGYILTNSHVLRDPKATPKSRIFT